MKFRCATVATALAVLLATVLFLGIARAEEPVATAEIPAAARVLAKTDAEGAAALLAELTGRPDASPDTLALAAVAALDELPTSQANPLAAELVLVALRKHPTHPVAWRTAFAVLDQVRAALDLATGERFLRDLQDTYPDYVLFRSRLAELYAACGHPREAEAEYQEVLRRTPNDTDARDRLAFFRELDGDPAAAVRLHTENIAIDNSLRAHRSRVQILWETMGDYDAAEAALAEALAEVDTRPPGEFRERWRADLEFESDRMAEYRQTREDLERADKRLNGIILAALGAWSVALLGGLALLRRRGWF